MGHITPSTVPGSSISQGASTGNKTPVTLGNGDTVYIDHSGSAFDKFGNPISNATIAAAKPGTPSIYSNNTTLPAPVNSSPPIPTKTAPQVAPTVVPAAPAVISTKVVGMTPVTLGNGDTVYVDHAGSAFDKFGNSISNATIAAAKPGAPSIYNNTANTVSAMQPLPPSTTSLTSSTNSGLSVTTQPSSTGSAVGMANVVSAPKPLTQSAAGSTTSSQPPPAGPKGPAPSISQPQYYNNMSTGTIYQVQNGQVSIVTPSSVPSGTVISQGGWTLAQLQSMYAGSTAPPPQAATLATTTVIQPVVMPSSAASPASQAVSQPPPVSATASAAPIGGTSGGLPVASPQPTAGFVPSNFFSSSQQQIPSPPNPAVPMASAPGTASGTSPAGAPFALSPAPFVYTPNTAIAGPTTAATVLIKPFTYTNPAVTSQPNPSPAFTPLSQLNTSASVYGPLTGEAAKIKGQTCLAVDLTMLAQSVANKYPPNQWSNGQNPTVSDFWNSGGATRGKLESLPGHPITFMSKEKTLPFPFPFNIIDKNGIDHVNPRLAQITNSTTALNDLKSGPILVGGEIRSDTGKTEVHWLLGVGQSSDQSGRSQIIANDPLTGRQVKIDTTGPNSGKITEIVNPTDGRFYPLNSDHAAYRELSSFDANGANGRYVAVAVNNS